MSKQESQYWQQRWQDGETAWDIGKPHRLTSKLWQLAQTHLSIDKNTKLKIYVPGCGQAHDAAFFAELGHDVVAADFAPGAIKAAQARYSELKNLQLRVEDAASYEADEVGKYDVIFDRAMLCALRPELRGDFLHACAKRLKSGGLFISLPFTKLNTEPGSGPPFEINEPMLRDLFAKGWQFLNYKPETSGHTTDRIREEALFVASRA